MRLTKKYKEDYFVNPENKELMSVDIENDHNSSQIIRNKLGQLEDIEEERGIDLILFGKVLQALDSDCVYVKIRELKQYNGYSLQEETGEIRRCVIARFDRYINGLRDWFFTISFNDISCTNHYLLKDYGKTWALTKEELL